MTLYTLRVSNIHCDSCENHVREVMAKYDPNAHVEFSESREFVTIDSAKDLDITRIRGELHGNGFDVNDRQPSFVGTPTSAPGGGWFKWMQKPPTKQTRAERHAQICDECDEDHPLDAFRAVFAVKGMTCASCSQSIVAAMKASIPEVLDVSADAISGVTYVLLPRRDLIPAAAKSIEDAGFSPTLTEVLPISATNVKEFKVNAVVGGMTCSSCANTVQAALLQVPGVTKATVEVINGSAEIFLKSQPDLDALKEAVEDAGYKIEFPQGFEEIHSAQAEQRARTVTLRVHGIFCERCPAKVMNALKTYGDAVDIVDAVSMTTPFVKFTYLPAPPSFTIRSILAKLAETNPELEFEIVRPKSLEEISAENQLAEQTAISRRLKLTSLIAIPTAAIMFNDKLMMNWKLLFLLSTPIYFFAADTFHRKALKEISMLFAHSSGSVWHRMFHFGSMNLLMSMGTSISYFASILVVLTQGSEHEETYFDSVIFLTFFLLIGRYLDIYSKIKTTSAVSMISKVRPDSVELILSDGSTKTVNIDLVEYGDKVAVFAGQRSAVDGVILGDSSSEFNEAMLTGESLPVPKSKGDEVYAGTLNCGQQSVNLRVTAVGKGTLLNDIVDAVRDGQMQRAPIENIVDQITSVFVPLVVYLALAVWIVWYFVSHDVKWSMQFAIATFVVACPCGIGLAAPTALYIGSGLTAKYGILARGGGEAFQEGAHIDVICFDKTGTITMGGDLRITDTSGAESDVAVQLAALLERDSVHPMAAAIIEYAKGRLVKGIQCETPEQIMNQGRGVRAKITSGEFAGRTAVLGNERLIREVGHCVPAKEQARLLKQWQNDGNSVVLLAIEGEQILLMLAFADQVRPESRAVVHRLQSDMGIQCWMISGDNEETARAVARKVGIPASQVIAGVLPQQKADKVRELQMTAGTARSHYGRAIVAMVGDGVNDAPALAASDVGIALGRGADIALSNSQFVLLREDLRALPILCEIAKAVMFKVKTNFFWAAFYNVMAIPVAAGVFYPWTHTRLDPVWASLAMALSSVSVMTSSLLLGRFRPKSEL